MKDNDERRERALGMEPLDEAGASIGDRLRLGGGIGGAGVLGLFLVQNLDDAKVNFLWMEWTIPLIFALVVSAVLGSLVTLVVGFFRRRGTNARLRADFARERKK